MTLSLFSLQNQFNLWFTGIERTPYGVINFDSEETIRFITKNVYKNKFSGYNESCNMYYEVH